MSEGLHSTPENIVPRVQNQDVRGTVSSFSLVANGLADPDLLEARRVFLLSALERLHARNTDTQDVTKREAIREIIGDVMGELEYIDNHCDDARGRVGNA